MFNLNCTNVKKSQFITLLYQNQIVLFRLVLYFLNNVSRIQNKLRDILKKLADHGIREAVCNNNMRDINQTLTGLLKSYKARMILPG